MSTPSEVPLDDEGEVVPETVAAEGRGGHLVAVVTGASRGIGRHVADALEDAGYAVERGSSSVAPVTDREALTAWVDEVVERHGRVDVLVNNAGVIDDEVDLFALGPRAVVARPGGQRPRRLPHDLARRPAHAGRGRGPRRQPQQRRRPPRRR